MDGELRVLEEQLYALETLLHPFAPELDAARQPERLREHLNRYTMHSERQVHHAVLGATEPSQASGEVDLFDADIELFSSPSTPADQDELGDNVELF